MADQKYSKKAQEKFEDVMQDFEKGRLRNSAEKKVIYQKQAVAIEFKKLNKLV